MSVAGWIVIAVLAVALVVAATGWILTARRRTARVVELTAELEQERTARNEATKANDHLETRMRSLRNVLANANQTNAELTTRIGRANPSEGTRALGLWALERHRQARLASTPLLGLAVGPGADLTIGLTEAIRVELELL